MPETIIRLGDCRDLLSTLTPASVDLAYLDPPFNTGRVHAAEHASFPDRWTGGSYVAFLRATIEAVARVLRPHGAILLHCDWRTVHDARGLLDEQFGEAAFVNHLIWSYGLGGSSPRRFARKHDDILYYAAGPDYYFDPPLVPATSQRMKGQMKKATDVLNIPAINNMAAERVGYPTQKPLALMDLLVRACAPPDGLVVDPCCGSGTTIVAALAAGRRA
ncbi:MAG: site-specific DNA-methyltransferase, partial [Phycisphaerales bacterium]|nr:site-specific DNA-methyltransferase [Phycisphaerales bacterium]